MTFEKYQNCLYKPENLLEGYNYQVKLGIDLFENCADIEAFKQCLKKAYPRSTPESVTLIRLSHTDFWKEINIGMFYRGDSAAGVELSEKSQEQFEILHKEYIDFISGYIDPDTNIYSYPDETGIPGYPVWWDYRFILLSQTGNSLFIYGSASD
ncbi:hypothetical protein ACX0G9_20280 [Flavitalea flava]